MGAAIAFQSLPEADWSERDLADAEVRFCDLRGVVLTGVAARGSFWQHCSLRGADLSGADLVDAVFSDCLLERASLRGADLTGARLMRCSFEEAALTDVCLREATTVECSFEAARLDGVRDVATARDLVVEILCRRAGDDPELLRWVGLVALKRGWCYEEWAQELAASPRHKELALEAFAPYPAAGFTERRGAATRLHRLVGSARPPVACAPIEDFVQSLRWVDVPAPVQRRVRHLLADFAAVSVAGRPAPAARIAADHAGAVHPGAEATALLDGRRLGALGAAWSNGVLANAVDMDDGHRLTKGHAGANVIPAALATAQLTGASEERFLAAVVVGYEVAIRAGIALHARDPAYHASGAWGAVGAAAAAASLLGLPAAAVRDAIGLAEYHAPIAGIMRSVAAPAMTKDACGHGAWLGTNAALLARRGFTSLPAEFLGAGGDGLGTEWRLLEVYVKAYPCCRWSQGAIHAALSLRAPAAPEIERVRITTFAAAAALARVSPASTEEAQYNLVWPVAAALVRGDFGVGDVLGPFGDPAVDALARRTEVEIDPRMEAAFPQRRLSGVTLELRDGRELASEVVEAPGEPEDPAWEEIVAGKVARLVGTPPRRPPAGDGLAGLGADELIGLGADELIGVLTRTGGGGDV